MQGFYVAIEGIDKCGKGTVIRGMEERYKSSEFAEIELYRVVEPNNENRMGRHIRACLADPKLIPDPMTFQEYYMVDRFATMVCNIKPAIARGAVVLADRSRWSTIAYGSLKLPVTALNKRHDDIVGSVMIWPHLTVMIDITAEEAIARLQAAGSKAEFFEKKAKLAKIRETYHTLMNEPLAVLESYKTHEGETQYRPRYNKRVIVDGMAEPSILLDRVWDVFSSHLRARIAQHS